MGLGWVNDEFQYVDNHKTHFTFTCNPIEHGNSIYENYINYCERLSKYMEVDESMAFPSYQKEAMTFNDTMSWFNNISIAPNGWVSINEKENGEMKLGQIVEVKDELNDIFDGEVIMLAPGYSKDDFTVKQVNNNEVIVIVKGNDGYKENAEYLFDLDGDYEVEKLDAKVVNGVFTLKANYKTDGNVEVKGE